MERDPGNRVNATGSEEAVRLSLKQMEASRLLVFKNNVLLWFSCHLKKINQSLLWWQFLGGMKQSRVDPGKWRGSDAPESMRFFTVILEIQPVPLKMHFVWSNDFLEMFSLHTQQSRLSLAGHMVWISRESRGNSPWWQRGVSCPPFCDWKCFERHWDPQTAQPAWSSCFPYLKGLSYAKDPRICLLRSHSPATRRLCDPKPCEPKFPHL